MQKKVVRHSLGHLPAASPSPSSDSENIRVVFEMHSVTDQDVARITSNGGRIIRKLDRRIAVSLPEDRIMSVAESLDNATSVRLPFRFFPTEVPGEGVNLTGANAFHRQGMTGRGAKVAVIDVGFKGLTEARASGDLPNDVHTMDFTGNGLETQYLHGTACAEIVHDMAPYAELHLLKVSDEIDVQGAFDYCLANQIRIISLSIGIVGSGPGDGTGPLADMADQARASGALIVAAAGNFGSQADTTVVDGQPITITLGSHWEGTFTDNNADGFHEFSGIDYNVIGTVAGFDDDGNPETNELTIILRWNDWPLGTTDYDLFLFDFNTGELVTGSTVVQDGTQPPLEVISFDVPDSQTEARFYSVVVQKPDGEPAGVEMEIYLGNYCLFAPWMEHPSPIITTTSNIAEPADAESVLAVGAINFSDWETGPQESFSSQGPTNAWAGSAARFKPDIMGPDGVNTSTYSTEGFAGTSAAAPHVAGAAALLAGAYPFLGPDDLEDRLVKSAIDMGSNGRDNIYGHGRLSVDIQFADWLPGTDSAALKAILGDDLRDRIYYGDAANDELVIIDSVSGRVARRLPMNSRFDELAISKDGSILAVAGGDLVVMDLDSLIPRKMDTNLDTQSVAFDHRGQLFISTTEGFDDIYHYDPDTESIITSFGLSHDLSTSWSPDILQTDSQGTILLAAIDSGALFKFDVSGATPVFMAEDSGGIGMIWQLLVAPGGDEIYSGTKILSAADLSVVDSFLLPSDSVVGYNFRGMDTDLAGSLVYISADGNYGDAVFQFDAAQRTLLKSYDIAGNHSTDSPASRGMVTDRFDKSAFVVIRKSINGYAVQLVALESLFSVRVPAVFLESDGTATGKGTVHLSEARSENFAVTLVSEQPEILSVPSTVTVPAGQTMVEFDVTLTDNALPSGSREVTITAEAAGLPTRLAAAVVHDDEATVISLSLPTSVSEDDGVVTGMATVSIDSPAGMDVDVHLSVKPVGEVFVPAIVTIHSGESSAEIDIHVVDDEFFDGAREVRIDARVEGWTPASATMVVEDNELSDLTITLPGLVFEGSGVLSDSGNVSVPGILLSDLVVNLSMTGFREITLPDTVTIPAGSGSATFDITVTDDWIVDGDQTITIAASADGWASAQGPVTVVDTLRFRPEFRTHDDAASNQQRPAAAGLAGGGFIVAWQTDDILARRFDNRGEPQENEIMVNSYTTGIQTQPAAAGLAGGEYVVVWQSRYQDGSGEGIYARLFNGTSNVLTDELPVNTTTDNNQAYPAVADLADGGFVIAWQSYQQDGSGEGIYARIFDASGNPLTDELPVNIQTDLNQSHPSVAGLAGGGFVVSWDSYIDAEHQNDILCRVFDAGGNPLTDELPVNTYAESSQSNPSSAALANGHFVITWQSYLQDGFGDGVFARTFDAAGNPLTGELPVNSITAGSQYYPAAAGLENGRFSIAWYSYMSGAYLNGIFTRIFSSNGNPETDEFQVNAGSLGSLPEPGIAGLDMGEFVIVWEKYQSGTYDDVFGQILTQDTDVDDDGIPGVQEDLDHSGTVETGETHPWMGDTDGDGIQDGTEKGLTLADVGPDTDLSVFIPDADPTTLLDPGDPDTDHDGIADGAEDTDANGRFDPGETDPLFMAGDLDDSGAADLADAIQLFQMAAGLPTDPGAFHPGADMDGDNVFSLGEAVFILQRLSGLRP